jgi:hypothetical protein
MRVKSIPWTVLLLIAPAACGDILSPELVRHPVIDELTVTPAGDVAEQALTAEINVKGKDKVGIVSAEYVYGDDSATEVHSIDRETEFHDSAVHRYLQRGVYEVSVTIVNADGLSATATESLRVGENIEPRAVFAWEPTDFAVPPATEITFDGSLSFDSDAGDDDKLRYKWDFGDGRKTDFSFNAVEYHVYRPAFVNEVAATQGKVEGERITIFVSLTVKDVAGASHTRRRPLLITIGSQQ